MPVYSIKEFAGLVGKPPKNIHTYISRKKVIKNSNGLIDSTVKENREFLELHQSNRIAPKKVNGSKVPAKKVNGKAKEIIKEVEEVVQLSPINKVTLEQKKWSNKKAKIDYEIKQLELKKLSGESINAKQAIEIVSTHTSNLYKDMVQQMEAHVQKICTRHGIPSNKTGEYKLAIPELLNKSVNKSVDSLLKKFGNE